MRFITAATLLIAVIATVHSEEGNPFKSAQKWIDLVNNDPHSTWKAGQNFNPNLPASSIKKLLGVKKANPPVVLPQAEPITDINESDIPKQFDSRKQWSYCKALQTVRDQGDCGSCWAVATSAAFTDRLCIATKGKFNSQLAAVELTSCCTECGDGCDGGDPGAAWEYFKEHGLVTGGDYGSNEGCQPYSLKPCEHHVKGPRPSCPSLDPTPTPACRSKCTNKKYKKSISQDNHKVKSAYSVSTDVSAIQKEIFKNGPVSAEIAVYEDFLSYKSGVYKNNPQSPLVGLHEIKVIGWGVEQNKPYWLVQNSWNSDWGDKGLIKVLRGKNIIGIESAVTAGLPSV